MSIEEIIRQATEAAKRTSSALENRSSQTPKNNQFDFSLNQKPQEIIEVFILSFFFHLLLIN